MQSRRSLLSLLIPCLGRRKLNRSSTPEIKTDTSFLNRSPPLPAPTLHPNEHLLVDRLVKTLCTHHHYTQYPLQVCLALTIEQSNTLNPTNWSWPSTKAAIAEHILNAISFTIQHSERFVFSDAAYDAYLAAREEAEKIPELAREFEEEHPILTWAVCVALALGTLYVLWPELIAVLGFGELGPVEGSFAAAWQSLYGGEVPIGSIFSLLQRLGMTMKGRVAGVQGEDGGWQREDEKAEWTDERSPSDDLGWKLLDGIVYDDEELKPLVQYE